MFLLRAAVMAAAVTLPAPAAAQPASPMVRLLRGVVIVDDQSAVPLRRARVQIAAPGLSADPTFTDDEGRFEVLVPAAAEYTLTVSKPGFAAQSVRRSPGADTGMVEIRMPRGAAITGRVVDEFDHPLRSHVRLQGAGRDVSVDTDGLGEFRVGSLPAGRYTVAAAAGFGSPVGSGGPEAAATVEMAAGDEGAVTLRTVSGDAAIERALFGLTDEAAERPDDGAGGTIGGRVMTRDGLPVGGAVVTLYGAYDARAITDASGRYLFEDVPAGAYSLSAIKSASSYLAEPQSNTVTLQEGETLDETTLIAERPPAVSGVVRDEYGEPVEGLAIQLWRPQGGGGRALLAPVNVLVSRAWTDDRGSYRLLAAPGDYYMTAADQGVAGRPLRAAGDLALRVFYPGSPGIGDALPVRVEWGRDAAGVDITFAPRAAGRIQGVALDANGQPLASPVILMESFRSGVPASSPRRAQVGASGAFLFTDVPAGDYVLHAGVDGPTGDAAEFAMAYVTVTDGDAAPVALRTSPGTTLRGRIVLDSARTDVDLRMFGLSVQYADWDHVNLGGRGPFSVIREDGSFEMAGLHGPMRVTGTGPTGWWLKSAPIGIVDAVEQPFTFGGVPRIEDVEVVFADNAGEVTGRVRDGDQPVARYTVLVFSTDRTRWWAPSGHVQMARPAADGVFRALSMPPGEYLAVAVDLFDIAAEWLDPDVLASLEPAARRITVRERQALTVDLDLIRRSR